MCHCEAERTVLFALRSFLTISNNEEREKENVALWFYYSFFFEAT